MAVQALVMGFGGTGTHILTYLKVLAVQKYGEAPDFIKFLEFDTIADWRPGKTVQIVGQGAEEIPKGVEDIQLDPKREYFYLGDRKPTLADFVYDVLQPGGQMEMYPHLTSWFHAEWFWQGVAKAALDVAGGAAQQRQIGRFVMFQNHGDIVSRIQGHLQTLDKLADGTDVQVWIVGSTVGGTGAGCMLDAAYLTRLAAQRVGINKLRLSGVFVLPDVYSGVTGISPARAYAMFRELRRVQSRPEGYQVEGKKVNSYVAYDAHGSSLAVAESSLFDVVFYVGEECKDETQRKNFFSKVASALDPYLDEGSGSKLIEDSTNDIGTASGFGAARLYIPIQTYTELFAWEEVQSFLEAIVGWDEEHHKPAWGSLGDRTQEAEAKFTELYRVFGQLLMLSEKSDKERADFLRTQSPRGGRRELVRVHAWCPFRCWLDGGRRTGSAMDLCESVHFLR